MHKALSALLLVLMSGNFALAKEGALVEIDGLKSRAPADWAAVETNSPMRKAQLKVGDAELTVFYFGKGQGGSVEQNLERWKKMFQPAEDSKVDTLTIGGHKATVLDIRG